MAGADDTDPFDEAILAAAADEYELDEGSLATVVRRHQESVAALPGIENLAYEWRKQYESPLIERTQAAYYLAVPDWVWEEFGHALNIRETMLDALVEVHRRTVVARTDAEPDPLGRMAYVVLDRNADRFTTDDT